MPQNGFHGLFGLATARGFARRLPAQAVEPFAVGVVLGAMLPDIDMYPTVVAVLLGRSDLTYVIHRSGTHSLLLVLLLLFGGLILRGKRPYVGWLGVGLSLGVATHLLLDLFFWFAQLDLFWPLSHLPADKPLLPVVDLWSGVKVPDLAINIREAFEFAAFALLVHALRVIVGKGEQSDRMLKWERFMWLGFCIALVTAFVFRTSTSKQNYVVTTPYLLAMLPYCWTQVWKLRSEIASWANRHQTNGPI